MTQPKTSRLAVLTAEQLVALREWHQAHGRNWRDALMKHFASGRDSNSPALRQIRNRHLPSLQSITATDFTLPVHVQYGTIACAREARDTLAGLGVEVAGYDDDARAFHVRVSSYAAAALAEHAPDFPVDRLQWVDDVAPFPSGAHGLANGDPAVLRGFAAKVGYLLHTPSLQASGSAPDLNWHSDLLDAIETELTRQQASPVSKLSELTRDEAMTLQINHSKGKPWLDTLLQRVERSPALYRPVMDLLTRRTAWVRSLTDDDFSLPVIAHYGRIRTTPDNETLLASFGVEVGDYDYKSSSFHVRVNARAYRNLQRHQDDFSLAELHPYDDTVFPSVEGNPDPAFLQGAKAHLTYLIHSKENDDRTTAGGSFQLDYWLEQRGDVDRKLAEQAQTIQHPASTTGRQDAEAPAP